MTAPEEGGAKTRLSHTRAAWMSFYLNSLFIPSFLAFDI